MVGISVSCTVCGRTFVDIDPAMVGKKARCSCGTVVLLQTPVVDVPLVIPPKVETEQRPANARAKPRPEKKVEQKRTEQERSEQKRTEQERSEQKRTEQERSERSQARRDRSSAGQVNERPKRPKTKTKAKANRPRRTQAEPIETVEPTLVESSPSARSRGEAKRSSSKSRSRSKSSRSPRTQPQAAAERPVVADSFADMDDILNGGVDRQPLRPKPQEPVQPIEQAGSQAAQTQASAGPVAPAVKASSSSASMISVVSIVGGMAGMLFGTIALAAKQLPLTETPIGWLSAPLHGMYQASFESGPVEGSYQTAFIALGWVLVVFSAVSLLTGLAYVARGLVALISGQFYIGWSRAVAAVVGGAALFLVLGITLTQYAHHDHLQLMLDQVQGEAGPIGLVQDLDNVRQIRQQYVAEKRQFSLAMMALVTLPLTMFVAAILNLFCDPRPGR